MIPIALAALLAVAPSSQACLDIGPSYDTQYTPVDDHTIVVRQLGRAFRIDTAPTRLLTDPFAQFTTIVQGPSRVCGAVDLRLQVSVPPGSISQPVAVVGFAPIGLDEAQALALRGRPARR